MKQYIITIPEQTVVMTEDEVCKFANKDEYISYVKNKITAICSTKEV